MAAKPATPPKLSPAVSFGTAGSGGVLAWVLVHPFNTLAVRMSLAGKGGGGDVSLVQFTRRVVKAEGFGALYKGLSAGVARQIFYSTSRFGLYEMYRDWIQNARGTKDVDFLTRLVAGSTSGGCAALISCPAEVTLVRMSNDAALPVDQRRNYRGIFDAFYRTAQSEGVGTFWRGSTPFCTRCVIVGMFQVATYDQFKQVISKQFNLEKNGALNVALSANVASLLYSFVTMPLETAKNRMAFQKPLADGTLPYRGTIQTIRSVATADGVGSLWNGYLPYYARCAGHTVLMFLFVEELRRQYLARVAPQPSTA
eukprot:TRINITY_DN28010_c0_g1_i1.p1 TRINITY_DN28010_c0_g1~~TRINITY_DN28010_c0_g1_i1.p1  ORF type:complete len:327 (+),score=125.33 TRINITY_DN28010_c0_g1_i1:46-981(+)